MVVGDKQTSHDSTSLCQKTWESSGRTDLANRLNEPSGSVYMLLDVVVVTEDGGTEEKVS